MGENGKVLTTWSVSGVEESIAGEKYSSFVHSRKLKEAQVKALKSDVSADSGAAAADSDAAAVEGEGSSDEEGKAPGVTEDASAETASEDSPEDARKSLPKITFTIGADSSGIISLSQARKLEL